ncbi:MAG: UvrD-helicase domain-containing protein, partial [Patulibacter sp.]
MSDAPTSAAAPDPSPQQRAVRARAGQPTVLVAAAGSGKTRVLTWLFADAHLDQQIALDRILAITFTNRAAGELRERIATALRGTALGRDPDLTEAWIGTFHGICGRLLREFAHYRALDPGFVVIDELAAAELQAAAWEDALQRLFARAGQPAADLVAQVGEQALRGAIVEWWTARRSDGDVHPVLRAPTTGAAEVQAALRVLRGAAGRLSDAIDVLRQPNRSSLRLDQATELVGAVVAASDQIARVVEQRPQDVAELAGAIAALPNGKPHRGAPLNKAASEVDAFIEARDLLARRLGELAAGPRVALLAELAREFSEAYERRKRADEALDHDDLELEALQLLRGEPLVRRRLAERFERILVDEFQDTNRRQAELIELLSGPEPWLHATPQPGQPAVTVVGDPRQAIYGFRNASVELICAAQRDAPEGVALELTTNYRSDRAVLAAIDRAWQRLDPEHQPVDAYRGPAPLDGEPDGARVELLITAQDRANGWDGAQLGGRAGQRGAALLAEARLIAARVAELRRTQPHWSIAVLARQRRVLLPVAGALADLGVEAVQDGAEGFWERLEVSDLVGWLRLVRNARDDAALLMVLASPLVALSTDGLAVVGDCAADGPAGTRLAAVIAAAEQGQLTADDAMRIGAVAELLERQRRPGRASDPCGLLDELIDATRYDEHLASLEEAERRLANVGRLRRLATDAVAAGGDLGALVDRAASEQRHGLRAPEAALGGGGAVQLMTVHQSKGLEFDVVIVAGLGQQGRNVVPALLGGERRVGVRLRPSPGAPSQALFDHDALKAERADREREELRRVLYVALTRARERLLVSGVAQWGSNGSPFAGVPGDQATVISWLGPALVPELDRLVERAAQVPCLSADGVRVSVSTPAGTILPAQLRAPQRVELPVHRPAVLRVPAGAPTPPLTAPQVLSYTALSRHAACGLRFYAEELLRLPPTPHRPLIAQSAGVLDGDDQLVLFGGTGGGSGATGAQAPESAGAGGLPATTVGTLVHAALERAPQSPTAAQVRELVDGELVALGVTAIADERERMVAMVGAVVQAPMWRELWHGGPPERERSFTVALDDGSLLTGVVDAQQRGPQPGEVLVVDYKTDRLAGEVDLDEHAASRYALQRAAYAFAALRGGAEAVRVVHLFLDGGVARPATLRVSAAELPALGRQLRRAVAPVVAGEAGAA